LFHSFHYSTASYPCVSIYHSLTIYSPSGSLLLSFDAIQFPTHRPQHCHYATHKHPTGSVLLDLHTGNPRSRMPLHRLHHGTAEHYMYKKTRKRIPTYARRHLKQHCQADGLQRARSRWYGLPYLRTSCYRRNSLTGGVAPQPEPTDCFRVLAGNLYRHQRHRG
jgi:hypothetical protein